MEFRDLKPPKDPSELLSYFMSERKKTTKLSHEMTSDLVEKRISIMKDRRTFLQNVALASATILGLSAAFTNFNTRFDLLIWGLTGHLVVIGIIILYLRQVFDDELEGLLKDQDRWNKQLREQIDLSERYVGTLIEKANSKKDVNVDELFTNYLESHNSLPSIATIRKEFRDLDEKRELRLVGKEQMEFYGEVISFFFILSSALIISSFSKLELTWQYITIGILGVFLVTFTNFLSVFLELLFRFLTHAQKDIIVIYKEIKELSH